jgi:hypothetical protein
MLIVVMAMTVYANTFSAEFTLDDFPIITENLLIKSSGSIKKIFLTDYRGHSSKFADKRSNYRPLTILSFRLNYILDRFNPRGYHLINVLLHTAVCVVLYLLLLLLC